MKNNGWVCVCVCVLVCASAWRVSRCVCSGGPFPYPLDGKQGSSVPAQTHTLGQPPLSSLSASVPAPLSQISHLEVLLSPLCLSLSALLSASVCVCVCVSACVCARLPAKSEIGRESGDRERGEKHRGRGRQERQKTARQAAAAAKADREITHAP